MTCDTKEIIWWAGWFIIIILCAGEPDLLDTIISQFTKG